MTFRRRFESWIARERHAQRATHDFLRVAGRNPFELPRSGIARDILLDRLGRCARAGVELEMHDSLRVAIEAVLAADRAFQNTSAGSLQAGLAASQYSKAIRVLGNTSRRLSRSREEQSQ